jgi:hypothetical protein
MQESFEKMILWIKKLDLLEQTSQELCDPGLGCCVKEYFQGLALTGSQDAPDSCREVSLSDAARKAAIR